MAVSSQPMATNLVKTMVYMPPDLREVLEKIAKRENRSLSNLIVTVMQRYAEEAKTE